MKESEKFGRGLAHFNAREFFEAHEAWEELWLVEAEPEKTFLQGLIQLAAAFHHYGRGNLRGARSLLAAGHREAGAVCRTITADWRWRSSGRRQSSGPKYWRRRKVLERSDRRKSDSSPGRPEKRNAADKKLRRVRFRSSGLGLSLS